MTTTDEAKGFEETLLDDPAQWDVRLIFADWLEERGREAEGAFQRYVVKYKLVPEPISSWYNWGHIRPLPLYTFKHREQVEDETIHTPAYLSDAYWRKQLEAAYKDLV